MTRYHKNNQHIITMIQTSNQIIRNQIEQRPVTWLKYFNNEKLSFAYYNTGEVTSFTDSSEIDVVSGTNSAQLQQRSSVYTIKGSYDNRG